MRRKSVRALAELAPWLLDPGEQFGFSWPEFRISEELPPWRAVPQALRSFAKNVDSFRRFRSRGWLSACSFFRAQPHSRPGTASAGCRLICIPPSGFRAAALICASRQGLAQFLSFTSFHPRSAWFLQTPPHANSDNFTRPCWDVKLERLGPPGLLL